MKTANIIQAVVLMILLALAASCRTSRSHRHDEKQVVIANPSSGNLPPGQAKKIYGDQSARNHAPGQKKKYGNPDYRGSYPLIIIRTPDIVVLKSSDGRYYHRNSDGFVYWMGQDDRFYLDEEFIGKTKYSDNQYEEWKQRGNKPEKITEKENKGNNGKGPKAAGKSH